MSGRRRGGLAPSLFPFLAVLVCTLGTLILLLALVAQEATETAKLKAEQERSSPASSTPKLVRADVESLIEEGQFRVAQLVSFRDQQTTDLEQRRDQLTHLEDHIRRLRTELQRLGDEVEMATAETLPDRPDETQLVELQAKLQQEQTALEQLRQSSQSKKPRVVIVPHQGPNGTDRRPVYVECTANGITLWPEGSRIDMLALLATDAAGNPLDAALRTIRLYCLQNYGDTIPPYPLLVVRPDGIETYAAARQAMLDWDDQFGYELVPTDVELAFNKPDPLLKQRVDVAIQEAVQQQRASHLLAGRGPSNGSGSRVRTLSAARLDAQGRAGGYYRDPNGAYGAYGSSSGMAAASSGDQAARQLDDHLRSAADELADGSGTAAMTRDPATDGPGLGTTSAGGSSSSGPLGTGKTLVPSASEMTLAPPGGGASAAALPSPDHSAPFTGSGEFAAATGGWGTEAAPGEPVPSRSEEMASGDASGETSEAGSAVTSGTRGPEGASGTGGDGGTQAQGSGSSVTSSSSMQGGSSSRGSADEAQGSNSVSATNSPPPQSTRQMIQRKGRDWALPDSVAGAHGTAVVRSIRVACYDDRFVLLAPASGGATEMFGFSDGGINRATLQLAAAVRDRIESWGPSLPGGRWQPRLEVDVTPNGVQRFEQLRTLMNGSGVDVIGRSAP